MGLLNGPADTPVQPPRSARDGEAAPSATASTLANAQGAAHAGAPASAPASAPKNPPKLVPTWLRDGARARRVMPLRTPPQPASSALPAGPASGRSHGADMAAHEGAAVKRLLQRSAPDATPPAVVPTRDPVALALGMVARLIVAGSAAAAVAMLLFGVVPLPFRLGATVATEGASTGSVPAKIEERLGDGANANAMATPPARVATVTVRAAPSVAASAAPSIAAPAAVPAASFAAAEESSAFDADELDRLIKRGEDYLAHGDIASARLVLGRAVTARDARAALSLAETYDPVVLKRLNVLGFRPDPAQARTWYEKAAGYGSAEASRRLDALPSVDR
jgi:hypothetical protein